MSRIHNQSLLIAHVGQVLHSQPELQTHVQYCRRNISVRISATNYTQDSVIRRCDCMPALLTALYVSFDILLYKGILGAEIAQSVYDRLRAVRVAERFPVEARFSAQVQTSPGSHPASYTMGTGGKAARTWR